METRRMKCTKETEGGLFHFLGTWFDVENKQIEETFIVFDDEGSDDGQEPKSTTEAGQGDTTDEGTEPQPDSAGNEDEGNGVNSDADPSTANPDETESSRTNEVELERDAYTIIAVAWGYNKLWTSYGISVVFFQFFVAILIIVTQVYDVPLPPITNPNIIIAQIIALCLFVLTNDDISLSLMVLMQRPTDVKVVRENDDQNNDVQTPMVTNSDNDDDDKNNGVQTSMATNSDNDDNGDDCDPNQQDKMIQRFCNRNSNKLRRIFLWINIVRLFTGIAVLAASFFFIVEADSVLEVFLNWAAVTFIIEIGNAVFKLARRGFFGSQLQAEVQNVPKLKINFTKNCCIGHNVKLYSMVVILILIFVAWGFVRFLYVQDEFIEYNTCANIQVDFATVKDYFNFPSENFSGEYTAKFDHKKHHDRPIYEFYSNTANSTAVFYYCEDLESWLFTIPTGAESNIVPDITKDYCGKKERWIKRKRSSKHEKK